MRPPRGARPVLAAALLLALLAVPQAGAFRSIAKGESPHDEATAVAGELGWGQDATQALQAAVRQPDIDDLRTVEVEDGKDRVDASITYRPWHHCTRQPPGGDADAFDATVAYVREQRGLAENLSLLDPAAAVRALGRALHALQDCFSHSNVVDLDGAAQAGLARSLLDGGPAPAGLRLCSVAPGTMDIERPPGDPYPHGDFNKDDAGSSPEADGALGDGRTKHEAALALAEAATREFLLAFMGRLDTNETTRLLEVRIDEGKEPQRPLGIPAPMPFAVVALGAAAVLRSRRP